MSLSIRRAVDLLLFVGCVVVAERRVWSRSLVIAITFVKLKQTWTPATCLACCSACNKLIGGGVHALFAAKFP